MNLLIRLVLTLIFAKRRKAISLLETCRTPFRVAPTDLDVLRHMNNGKYFSLQDLARVDLMIRAKTKDVMDRNGWYPVVVNETLQFKKSLKLFEKFWIETRVVGWDEKAFFVEHRFVRSKDVAAIGFVKARFLKVSGGSVAPAEILRASGYDDVSPALPREILAWDQSSQEHAASRFQL